MSVPLARIRAGTPRYRAWLEVFGCDVVPLTSADPHRGPIAPEGDERRFLALPVAALSASQRDRLVAQLARGFGLDAAEVSRSLASVGVCPILAEDVEVIAP